MPSKPAKKQVKPKKQAKPSPKEAKFTIQQLAAIRKALLADPATKKLVDRLINSLHDPGTTEPPDGK